jgi:hypothetical protein
MIPQLITVSVRSRPGRHFRLWIPLLPIYVILSPILFLAIIAGVVACARYRINPIRVLIAATRLLSGLAGLHIDIKQGHSAVKVKLA